MKPAKSDRQWFVLNAGLLDFPSELVLLCGQHCAATVQVSGLFAALVGLC